MKDASYYRRSALLPLVASLWMVMLGVLNAYYIHLGTFWTVAFFAVAAFASLGVPLRLWLARAIERRQRSASR